MTQKYQAYLLRLWQTDDLEKPTWLASLENPGTRQVTGFASLEALCTYLLLQKGDPPSAIKPSALLGNERKPE